ncbi:hypothetical protein NEF87_000495 [Candidatus Lokiarchaeum ossiferum]|uniref:ArnR1-like winged helix-turn-helix domain-containing protein n=1 Tax=Candidatus Lokiarchaeum ossiferum TaxID=2951803 RepID=A0ABY6HLD3_9ARCH|nr:hypothetical protein NEF87_000495 [Candidatus Lokiarchaeum sp. B-35]
MPTCFQCIRVMTASANETNTSSSIFDISLLKTFKLIEYLQILAENPKGLSRIEIRNMVPISSSPEIKCTETLFEGGFIVNVKILKGKKFKLTQKGLSLWKLIQVVDLFIKKTSKKTLTTTNELQLITDAIEELQNFKEDLSRNKGQIDRLSTLYFK